MATKNWQPNEKQNLFLNTLKETDGSALTLAEISNLAGVEFKTGTINPLVSKGLVVADGEREIIVQTKRKVKTYRLI